MKYFAFSLVFAILSGCGQSPEDETASASAPSHDTAVEAKQTSWKVQLDAVRSGRSDSIRVSDGEIVTKDDFRDLASDGEPLKSLWIERAELVDEDLRALRSLPQLSWLRLPTAVGDTGMAFIAECRELKNLNLPNGRFTDAGLAQVSSLRHLESLRFGSPNVTDDGLSVAAELPRLRFLHLLGVGITDSGLGHIERAGSLESFYLDGGKATDDGLRMLLRKRTDLHFHKDQRHLADDPNSHDHE